METTLCAFPSNLEDYNSADQGMSHCILHCTVQGADYKEVFLVTLTELEWIAQQKTRERQISPFISRVCPVIAQRVPLQMESSSAACHEVYFLLSL